jgi:hypothetical protein
MSNGRTLILMRNPSLCLETIPPSRGSPGGGGDQIRRGREGGGEPSACGAAVPETAVAAGAAKERAGAVVRIGTGEDVVNAASGRAASFVNIGHF